MNRDDDIPWRDAPHPADLADAEDAPEQHGPTDRVAHVSAAYTPEPPHAIEAEREVLAAVLVDPTAIEHVARVPLWAWYADRHQRLAHTMLGLHARGVGVDPVTLAQALRDGGHWQWVGESRAIGELLDRAGTVANVGHYADVVIAKARLRRILDVAAGIQREGQDGPDLDAFAARAETELGRAIAEARPTAVQRVVIQSLEAHGPWLEEPPPARPVLLSAPTGEPFLPDAKVAVLVGSGGSGKTFALTQLALAVASGTLWLDTYRPIRRGRVLLALGEETLDEVQRRVWQCSRGLDDYQRHEVARNVVPLGLSGQPVAMLQRTAEGAYGPTPWFEELSSRLEAMGTWRLIILDPWSRWGGPDVEEDSHAATRAVELAERLTLLPGSPAVVMAHHARKRMGGQPRGSASADDSRGSSALVDGARWCANLTRLDDEGMVEVRVTKANYTVPGAPLLCMRRKHGVLGAAQPAEIQDYEERLQQRRKGRTP